MTSTKNLKIPMAEMSVHVNIVFTCVTSLHINVIPGLRLLSVGHTSYVIVRHTRLAESVCVTPVTCFQCASHPQHVWVCITSMKCSSVHHIASVCVTSPWCAYLCVRGRLSPCNQQFAGRCCQQLWDWLGGNYRALCDVCPSTIP